MTEHAHAGTSLRDLARQIIAKYSGSRRLLVAIAGPPGAGKSTLAQAVVTELNRIDPAARAVLAPMDGFHMDNATLEALGLRHRKGAPETFQADAFCEFVATIAGGGEVDLPGFDRDVDTVVMTGKRIGSANRVIVFEGNYLLLNEKPWDRLREVFDMTVFINPGMEELERRLIQRWLDHGMEAEAACKRALENDIPNARRVVENSFAADVEIAA